MSKKLEGVKEVQMDLLSGTATIVFQLKQTQYSTIKKFVESFGCYVKKDRKTQLESNHKESLKAKQKLILSWIFHVPFIVLVLFKMVTEVKVVFYLGRE